MLQDFQNITVPSNDVVHVLGALVVSLICGFIISFVYRWTYRGSSYSPSFVRSMIFLAMITAIIMLVIGNNLARAFGLVGAMSIIRFRTAVKDPQDIVFIFFALAVGLAAGVGMYMIALVGTVFIGAIIAITSKSGYAVVHKQSFLLQFSYNDAQSNGEATYLPVLKQYAKKYQLINVRSIGKDESLDLTFYVNLRNEKQRQALTQDLGQARHVSNVNLYYDTEQM